MTDKANSILKFMPEILTGKCLKEKLLYLPKYATDICSENNAIRLMELNNIYNLYLPSDMSCEIYSKLYLAMIRSLQKKESKLAVMQRNENYKCIKQNEYSGVIGGSDSFTIIGISGIGKSSAITRSVNIITENRIIETDEPYMKIIPCMTVQCPFDCSVKGLLLQVLRQIDEELQTHYYEMAVKSRATTDMLIGSVSQCALNHIGLLIVDEIQNVVNHRNGIQLIGMLTQLINNSGIAVCMVGTPESEIFFERVDYLARRTLGLKYVNCKYDEYFKKFCKTIFGYQYVKNRTELTDGIINWLYEHSSGIISTVVALIHDAQEISILNEKEVLDLSTLNEAYQQRMGMIHAHINSSSKKFSRVQNKSCNVNEMINVLDDKTSDNKYMSISELVIKAKKNNINIIKIFREYFTVEEV